MTLINSVNALNGLSSFLRVKGEPVKETYLIVLMPLTGFLHFYGGLSEPL